jgi:hypothetical protein
MLRLAKSEQRTHQKLMESYHYSEFLLCKTKSRKKERKKEKNLREGGHNFQNNFKICYK